MGFSIPTGESKACTSTPKQPSSRKWPWTGQSVVVKTVDVILPFSPPSSCLVSPKKIEPPDFAAPVQTKNPLAVTIRCETRSEVFKAGFGETICAKMGHIRAREMRRDWKSSWRDFSEVRGGFGRKFPEGGLDFLEVALVWHFQTESFRSKLLRSSPRNPPNF